jgi:tRNA (mo5U34)-methyltransferase
MTSEPPHARSRDETESLVKGFPFWYQRIYLGNGVYSLPHRAHHEEVWDRFRPAFPADLGGCSVLDLGTNAGYFPIQLKLRGAGKVVGLEFIDWILQQAELCKAIWGVDVDYRKMDAHAARSLDGRFDLVVFTGLLYHLRNPLQVIEDAGRLCNDAILVETEIIPDDPRNCVVVRQGAPATLQTRAKGVMKFLETNELNGDGSNWWVPDTECVMGMLRTAGFRFFSRPLLLGEARLCLLATKKESSLLDVSAL